MIPDRATLESMPAADVIRTTIRVLEADPAAFVKVLPDDPDAPAAPAGNLASWLGLALEEPEPIMIAVGNGIRALLNLERDRREGPAR